MADLEAHVSARLMAATAVFEPLSVPKFAAYLELLKKWNRSINLTALPLDPFDDEAIDRLVVEPVLATSCMSESTTIWFDFGSGGGSPAIPMKILRPLVELTMVEATGKKAAFLKEAVRVLGLTAVNVEHARFEELAKQAPEQSRAQLVSARAVRNDRTLFQAAAELLSFDGELWLFRSADAAPFLDEADQFRHERSASLVRDSVLEVFVPRQDFVPRGTGETD